MKCKISLHSDDIAEIIAEKFEIPTADVKVYTEKKWAGQGPSEHEIHVVRAKISIPADRISVPPKKKPVCGDCALTGGKVDIVSEPPLVICAITGKTHHQTDLCDCEEQRKEGAYENERK